MSSRRRRIRGILFLSGLVLLVGTSVFTYLCYHFPVGEGPAGPTVPLDPFQHLWTQRKVLLVGIGDSVTAGFGVPKERSYFELLVRNSHDDWQDMQGRSLSSVIPNLSALNLAISGSTSISHAERQIPSLKVQPEDVLGLVVITTGGNDIIHDYGRSAPREGAMYGASLEQAQPWVKAFGLRLEQMIQNLNHKFPGGCVIFIADIYDPTDGKGVPWIAPYPSWKDQVKILAQYNQVIHQVCRGHPNVHLVPAHAAFQGHGLCCSRFWEGCYRREDPCAWYAGNIEDPNSRGYDALRRLFLLEISKVLQGQ